MKQPTTTREMLTLIAENIPENNVDDLITVYNAFKEQGKINFFQLKELNDAGIPVVDELCGILDMQPFDVCITARLTGIDFSYIETVFKNLTAIGAKFNKIAI